MREDELKKVADGADLIVNGYAFTKTASGGICVLNLNTPNGATVFSESGEMIETSMDDIELRIATDYLGSNR